MTLTQREIMLTPEVMAYFTNRIDPLAPSQIDRVMGLERGKAHDIIVRKWSVDEANARERISDYHE